MSTRYWAQYALLPTGPARDVLLVEQDGRWASVQAGARPTGAVTLTGVTIPGFANCHSHAFHRALRGRTHGDGGTFWTWREHMYAAASRLEPGNYRQLARAVYAEMALSGITAVGEFHYVHHQGGGVAYPDPQAMDHALREAAREAGVRLTLLDTCYLYGGLDAAGHQPLADEQVRFSDGDVEAWVRRHALLRGDDNTVIGAAIHSVRAVAADDMPKIVAASAGQPLHAHVSEQPAENDAAHEHYGMSPTGILAGAGAISADFTAVHATHLSDDDVQLLGRAGATACFCPTTERDLADGIGPARELVGNGARMSLGSDQHAVIDMFEECRALEHHERLVTNRRGHFSMPELMDAATNHESIGWPDAGSLSVGQRADAVSITLTSPRTAGSRPDQVLMSASAPDVHHVVSGGRVTVRDGVHVLGDTGQLLGSALDALWRP